MHNLWTRANAVFVYSITILFFLAIGSAFSTHWLTPTYKINRLELRQLKTLRPQRENWQRNDLTDRAILTFDLDADLRKVWNWNVKQLFIYITARYVTNTNVYNEIVIWDKIVNRTQDSRLRLNDVYNKYPIIDYGTELRDTPITLTLNWDVMPITGSLYSHTVQTSTVRMPPMYCTEVECKPVPLPLQILDRPTVITTTTDKLHPQKSSSNGSGGKSDSSSNAASATFVSTPAPRNTDTHMEEETDEPISIEVPVNGNVNILHENGGGIV